MPTATEQLWRYLFGVDLMSNIQCRLGPADHPLLLMVAEPRRLQLRVGDGLWVRIVDVPAALSAPVVLRRRIAGARCGRRLHARSRRPLARDNAWWKCGRPSDQRCARPPAGRGRPGCGLPGWLPICQPRTSGAHKRVRPRRARQGGRDVRHDERSMVPRGLLSGTSCPGVSVRRLGMRVDYLLPAVALLVAAACAAPARRRPVLRRLRLRRRQSSADADARPRRQLPSRTPAASPQGAVVVTFSVVDEKYRILLTDPRGHRHRESAIGRGGGAQHPERSHRPRRNRRQRGLQLVDRS